MPERVYTLECENYVDNDGKRLTDEESTKHLINCEQPADINAKLEHQDDNCDIDYMDYYDIYYKTDMIYIRLKKDQNHEVHM